jgi:hypothetical protein
MIFVLVAVLALGALILFLHLKGKKQNAIEAAKPEVGLDIFKPQTEVLAVPRPSVPLAQRTDTSLMAAIRPEDRPF